MILTEFKKLSDEEKCLFVNARLKEKGKKGFKGEGASFSFASAEKVLKDCGIYEIDGIYMTAEQTVSHLQEKEAEEKKGALTVEDIDKLLALLEPSRYDTLLKLSEKYNYVSSYILKEDCGIKIKAGSGAVKNTTMRVYSDTLEKWQEFTSEQKEFSTLNLLNTALLEFMDRHR